MELLTIAFYLSVLTYYLGVLFYMLPIPFYGVKKWAPQLMIDGVFSAILVFSYQFLVWLIDYLGSILGADWNYYNNWLAGEIGSLISLMLTLKAIGISLSSIGLQFLANGLVSPLLSSLTYILLFIMVYTSIASILTILAPTLIALGILLHSIPFRLTRSSGATIIAIVIIFSTAAPLMPQFIETFTTSLVGPGYYKYGLARALLNIRDARGAPVSYAVFEARGNGGELLARYLSDENGVFNASTIETGIPGTEFIVNITIAGYYYVAPIDPENYSSMPRGVYNITLILPTLIQIQPLRLTAVFNTNYTVTGGGENYIVFETSGGSPEIVVITLPGDEVSVWIDYSQPPPDNTIQYEWDGVMFKAYIYHPGIGTHEVEVVVSPSGEAPKPRVKIIQYVADTLRLGLNNPAGYIEPVVYYMYSLFIAPLVYVSILVSTSLALAKLLGGSTTKIAQVVVTGI